MLTSLRLPDMDGVELVKRCQRASPETEIILTTTYCSVSVAIEVRQAVAFFFIEKPAGEDHTLHLINQAISSRAQKAGIMQSSAGWKDRFAHYSLFLPDMDGFDLLKDCERRSPRTRILILTQKVLINEEIKAMWAGPLPLSRSALTH